MILFLYYLFTIPLSLRTIYTALNSGLLDYSYYLGSTQEFLSGINPYTNLLYPPASLFFITPFALTPFYISKIIWTCLSLISFYFSILIIVKDLQLKNRHFSNLSYKNIALIFFLFFMQTFPVKFTLALGQINFFVLLGYSIFFHLIIKSSDSVVIGLTLSILTILKFNPVFFVLFLVITKSYKSILVFILSFISLNLFIDLFSSHNLNISFIQSLLNMSSNYSTYYYNQSLAAFFGRQFSDPFFAKIATNNTSIIIWLVTLITVFRSSVSHHSGTVNKYYLSFSLFLTSILLTSPLTWQHHLIFTIPIFLFLISNYKSISLYTSVLSTLSFILININLKNPQIITPQNPLYSHALAGLVILLITLVKVYRSQKHSNI